MLPEFQVLQEKLEIERDLRVLHAGVMLVTRVQVMRIDVVEAFKVECLKMIQLYRY